RVGDEDRGEVEAGEYAVDFWFHVQGTLSVGKDTQTTQTNKIDWIGLFALALSKCNDVTMDSIIKEFLGMPEHDVDDIKDEAQDLVDALKGTTKQSRKGPVKFLGVIQEPVDDV